MKEYFEKIYKQSADDFYSLSKDALAQNKKMFVAAANPEMLMIAGKKQ